jgi:hypothetical protein
MPQKPTEQVVLIVDQEIEFLDWATKHLAAKDLKILRTDNFGGPEATRKFYRVSAMRPLSVP